MSSNSKSDLQAKLAYVLDLEMQGYTNIKIVKGPSDIIAEKAGQLFYFEIKMTRQTDTYFGAATLTEWIQAFKTPENFKFVIAQTLDDVNFVFTEFTPEEFMNHSTIPPFKIFFNINLNKDTPKRKTRSAIKLNKETMDLLIKIYDDMKQPNCLKVPTYE